MTARALLAAAVLTLVAGCTSSVGTPPTPPGGGGATATTLRYVDPPATAGWRLVKVPAASTPARLVLALVGPAGTMTRGAAFNLKAPPTIRFGAFEEGWPVHDTGVYELFNQTFDPVEARSQIDPALLAGGVKAGNVLSVGVFQKDRRLAAKDSGRALLHIALEVRPGGADATRPGPIELTVPKGRVLPDDIGTWDASFVEQKQKGRLEPIEIAVGTLTAG